MKRIVIPILIVLLGVGGMMALIESGGQEQRTEVVPVTLHVTVIEAQPAEQVARVYSSGVVRSAQEVNIVPQIAGKIVSIAEGLQPGRRFEKGEIIAQIESTDYLLALKQEKGRVEQAQLNLRLEKERLDAAQREWELLGKEGEAPELASRRPQFALAELNVQSADAAFQRAELALGRTVLRSPFNSVVKMEQLDIGQVVGQGAPVATLQGTDQFWVRVSVPASRLADIAIPDINSETGSEVTITYAPSSRVSVEKKGRVLRLESELDPQARTASVLVGIDSPLQGDGLPLMLGAFVDVEVDGNTVSQAYRIPLSAVRDGTYVLIADTDDTLQKRDVEIGWNDGDQVVLLSGLDAGDRIITTSITYPIYGTNLVVSLEQ